MNTVMAWGGSQFKRKTAEMVVQYCIDRLMPRMKTLDICIQLSKDMDHADGYCLAVDNREFVIEVDSRLKGDDFITALTHEMVHVKQYARGETKEEMMERTGSWKDVFEQQWKGARFYAAPLGWFESLRSKKNSTRTEPLTTEHRTSNVQHRTSNEICEQ